MRPAPLVDPLEPLEPELPEVPEAEAVELEPEAVPVPVLAGEVLLEAVST